MEDVAIKGVEEKLIGGDDTSNLLGVDDNGALPTKDREGGT